MADIFSGAAPGTNVPLSHGFAITADGQPVAQTTRAIYVGTGGSLVCILAGDTTAITLTNVASGALLNLRVKAVMSTSTASGLVGLY